MVVPYAKPWLSYDDQLTLLESRGMAVPSRPRALEYLQRAGYYRLSAYWYPYREPGDPVQNDFVPRTSFDDVIELYLFDQRLKSLVADAIGRVEVAVRAALAYQIGKIDPFDHTSSNLFKPEYSQNINPLTSQTEMTRWNAERERLVNRSSEEFVDHFKRRYGLPLPIWVEIETWDFGVLSRGYAGLRRSEAEALAATFNVGNEKTMASWLRNLNLVRNIVAHHARLWNRNIVDQVSKPSKLDASDIRHLLSHPAQRKRVFATLCVLLHFMDQTCPRSSWRPRLLTHLETLEARSLATLADMGFPSGWEKYSLWAQP